MIPGVVNIEFLTPELAAKLSASQGQMAMAEHVLAAAASGKGSAAARLHALKLGEHLTTTGLQLAAEFVQDAAAIGPETLEQLASIKPAAEAKAKRLRDMVEELKSRPETERRRYSVRPPAICALVDALGVKFKDARTRIKALNVEEPGDAERQEVLALRAIVKTIEDDVKTLVAAAAATGDPDVIEDIALGKALMERELPGFHICLTLASVLTKCPDAEPAPDRETDDPELGAAVEEVVATITEVLAQAVRLPQFKTVEEAIPTFQRLLEGFDSHNRKAAEVLKLAEAKGRQDLADYVRGRVDAAETYLTQLRRQVETMRAVAEPPDDRYRNN